jgi:hypothetical protein
MWCGRERPPENHRYLRTARRLIQAPRSAAHTYCASSFPLLLLPVHREMSSGPPANVKKPALAHTNSLHKAAPQRAAGFGGSNSGAAAPPGSLAAAGATTSYVGGVGPKAKAAAGMSSSPGGGGGAGDAPGAGIGRPTNVQRVVHVEWDPKTGTFKGLPNVWKSALPDGASRRLDGRRARS